MRLTRHHGLGNVFLVAFVDSLPVDARERARLLCNTELGIGADGLIFAIPAAVAPSGLTIFVLFNRDGSRAEVSGNGLRCLGQAIARARGVTDLELDIETDAGLRRIVLSGTSHDQEVLVTVDMGSAGFGPDLEGLNIDLGSSGYGRVASVNVGNPHLVVEVDDPLRVDLAAVGPVLEAWFAPEGCNIHLLTVESRSKLSLRSWERGVGLTEACGTGACAAAHVAFSWGAIDTAVEVDMAGGEARVEVGETLRLTGPATFVDEHEVTDG